MEKGRIAHYNFLNYQGLPEQIYLESLLPGIDMGH
jgi:hypothetical protein